MKERHVNRLSIGPHQNLSPEMDGDARRSLTTHRRRKIKNKNATHQDVNRIWFDFHLFARSPSGGCSCSRVYQFSSGTIVVVSTRTNLVKIIINRLASQLSLMRCIEVPASLSSSKSLYWWLVSDHNEDKRYSEFSLMADDVCAAFHSAANLSYVFFSSINENTRLFRFEAMRAHRNRKSSTRKRTDFQLIES